MKIFDSLPLYKGDDVMFGDLTVLSDGTTYMYYNGGWHLLGISSDDRQYLRKLAGHVTQSEKENDYDRAMRSIC